MAYFEAKNLKQSFDTVSIDVSFECEKCTMTSIVGPSGSGKSTVLRLISGLIKSDSGDRDKCPDKRDRDNCQEIEAAAAAKILLDGKDVTEVAPARREIGMVFQSHTLFDHLKVEDNVAYGLVSSGMKKKEARAQANEFLKQFELEGFGRRYPETLSGGEAQRVSLARTLIMKPKLVLFDEPLSALDAPLRKKLAALIRNLQKTFGFTGIMVTHDINEAKAVSDNIILMKKGKIIWQGKAADFDEKLMEGEII